MNKRELENPEYFDSATNKELDYLENMVFKMTESLLESTRILRNKSWLFFSLIITACLPLVAFIVTELTSINKNLDRLGIAFVFVIYLSHPIFLLIKNIRPSEVIMIGFDVPKFFNQSYVEQSRNRRFHIKRRKYLTYHYNQYLKAKEGNEKCGQNLHNAIKSIILSPVCVPLIWLILKAIYFYYFHL